MTFKELMKQKQGYYYLAKVTWTKYERTFIHEFGNEDAAKNWVEKMNRNEDAKASYERVEL